MSDSTSARDDLRDGDVGSWSDAALSARLLELIAERDALTAQIRLVAGEWDKRMVWAGDGARSGHAWLGARTELSRGAGSAELKVARRLRSMPVLAEASASGELGGEKVAAITRAVERDVDGAKAELFARDEAMLVEQAASLTVEQTRTAVGYWRRCADDVTAREDAAHHHRERFLRLVRTFDGAWDLQGRLEPVEGEVLSNRLTEVMGQLRRAEKATLAEGEQGSTPSQRRADALMELVERAPSTTSEDDSARPLPLLLLDVPLEALEDRTGEPATLPDGTTLAAETLARLACEAGVAVVLTRDGFTVVELGRSSYTPNRAQRRALAKRDGHCVFPGCDLPVAFTDAHHLWHWEDGGLTDLWNLVLLCRFHHHAVHEGGFRLAADAQGYLHATRPDGTPIPWPHGQAPHRIHPRPSRAPAPPGVWPYDRPLAWPDGHGPPPGWDEVDELTWRRRTDAAARRRIDELINRRRPA